MKNLNQKQLSQIFTLTLNPSIDQVVQVTSFKLDEVNIVKEFSEIEAGKGINVSKYLSYMGISSTVCGFMSKKDLSFFNEALHKLQINTLFEILENTSVRKNITLLDENNKTSTHLACQGFQINLHSQKNLFEKIDQAIKPNDFLVICGSYPSGFDFEEFNQELERWQKRNINIILDNNGVSLSKINDISRFFIKPNLSEFEGFVNKKFASIDELCLFINNDKIINKSSILITLGKEGMLYSENERILLAKLDVKRENIVSNVGCGDAALAGFIFGKIKDFDINLCLKYSIACAVSKLGHGEVGKLDSKNVEELKDAVEVNEYKNF